MSIPESLLFVAFPPELAGLDSAPPFGWRVATTGIGAITAIVTVTQLLNAWHPKKVLFIGTCGAYTKRLNIGDCVAVSGLTTTSVPELQQRAFRPSLETTQWQASWELPSSLPRVKVAVTPAITSDTDDARLLGEIADAEHLELAMVFAACQMAEIPVGAALVVANHVGPNAHAEWIANHERVSRKLVKTIMGLHIFDEDA
jgi:purine-nucleoside phosphorylase